MNNLIHFDKLRYNISYYGADYPVDSLVKRMHEKSIVVPKFQRGYVWKSHEASRFIESLLLGLPVPSIFLAKDKLTNKLIIVDGQQRLKTLLYFYKGEFPNGTPFRLKYVQTEFKGVSYADLSMKNKHQLDDSVMHAIVMQDEDNSDAIYHLFERLNTSGTPLTPQEIRAAIYFGNFNDMLFELSDYPNWEYIYKQKDDRLADQEHILRFISLYFHLDDYSGGMLKFLNEFMMTYRMDANDNFKRVFTKTVDFLREAIGHNAFSKVKSKFNTAVYDSTMVGTAILLNRNDIDIDKFKKFYTSLKEDKIYLEYTKGNISSKKSIQGRIQYFVEKFKNYE